MTTVEEHLVKAIFIRNKVAEGTEDSDWVRARIRELYTEGFWNNSQIATLTGYERQSIGKIVRGSVRPSEPLASGTLALGALDLLLELRGATSRGSDPNASLVRAAVKTGTSTRLIAMLTGISIGVVLYQQRKLNREEEVEGWLSESTEPSSPSMAEPITNDTRALNEAPAGAYSSTDLGMFDSPDTD